MALQDWVPARRDGVLARCGYAQLRDLDDSRYEEIILAMEGFQAEFIARTRSLWRPEFPIPADALGHFSRQWEFPYVWANLVGSSGRVLDAGSGITFFPFLLAAAGYEVDCCDGDESLGLEARFDEAVAATGCSVRFTRCDLTETPYAPETFDAAVCISVLEHVGSARTAIVEELARVVRPGGRLVVTCDVDLRRDGGMQLEDVALLLADVGRFFDLASPLDLRRPLGLLTSESFLRIASWRLPPPWRPPPNAPLEHVAFADVNEHFRTIAILGTSAARRADA